MYKIVRELPGEFHDNRYYQTKPIQVLGSEYNIRYVVPTDSSLRLPILARTTMTPDFYNSTPEAQILVLREILQRLVDRRAIVVLGQARLCDPFGVPKIRGVGVDHEGHVALTVGPDTNPMRISPN